jgi:hypothetical protein
MQFNRYVGITGVIFAIFPACILAFLMLNYCVNVPYWDDWLTPAKIFQLIENGNFSWQALIEQHNESRKVFPKLLFIVLAFLSREWNVKQSMVAAFLLTCITSVSLYRLSQLSLRGQQMQSLLLAFLTNLLLFSPIQSENWTWGLSMVIYIVIASLAVTILVFYSKLNPRLKVFLHIAFSTVSTFSFVNGLLCWVVIFPAIFFSRSWQQIKREKVILLLWLTSFLGNLALYFSDYQKPSHHPNPAAALTHPINIVLYFLSFIGAPLSNNNLGISITVGCAIVTFWVVIGVYLLKFRHDSLLWERAGGWLSLGLYGGISGLVASVGRVGFGVSQSLASRYTSHSVLLLIAVIFLIAILMDDAQVNRRWQRLSFKMSSVVAYLLGVGMVLYAFTATAGIQRFQTIYRDRLYVRACLTYVQQLRNDNCVDHMWFTISNPTEERQQFKQTAKAIDRLGWLHPKLAKNAVISQSTSAPGGIGGFDTLFFDPQTKTYRATGWAVLAERSADAVLLTYDNSQGQAIVFAVAPVQESRPDVGLLLKSDAFANSGWSKTFSRKQIKPKLSNAKIRAWSYDVHRQEAWQSGGIHQVSLADDSKV